MTMTTRTRTRTRTKTGMATEPAALLRLLAWLSPAFPVGGFAYSHGLEWAVETRAITNPATTQDWVAALLAHGSGRNDAILLAHAHRGDDDGALVELALALSAGRERLLETTAQGRAFAAAARAWNLPRLARLAETHGPGLPYPVALGAACGEACIGLDDALLAYLHAFAAQLISAAVRLVPLGQAQGLAMLAALEPSITEVAREAATATLAEIGGVCFRADLASLAHETQYTRLFRA